jgi:hypothetical protein
MNKRTSFAGIDTLQKKRCQDPLILTGRSALLPNAVLLTVVAYGSEQVTIFFCQIYMVYIPGNLYFTRLVANSKLLYNF